MEIQHMAPGGPVIPDCDEIEATDIPDEEEDDEEEDRDDIPGWDDDWYDL